MFSSSGPLRLCSVVRPLNDGQATLKTLWWQACPLPVFSVFQIFYSSIVISSCPTQRTLQQSLFFFTFQTSLYSSFSYAFLKQLQLLVPSCVLPKASCYMHFKTHVFFSSLVISPCHFISNCFTWCLYKAHYILWLSQSLGTILSHLLACRW